MSVRKRKITLTLGDFMDGFLRNIIPYYKTKLSDFEAIEPHQFNEILKTYLDYKREALLDPNAL